MFVQFTKLCTFKTSMKKFVFYSLCLFLVACSTTKPKKPKMGYGKMTFNEVSHGTYTLGKKETHEALNTPLGTTSTINGVTLIAETDTIEGTLGNAFGAEFRFESDYDKDVRLIKVWNFPTMTNEKGESYTRIESEVTLSTNYTSFTTYEFEKDFEIVPGNWRLLFFYKDKLIYDKTFFVVKK
ncbi:MAG: hypothetical protein CFE21_12465 [Bacteroidetes bacterium B1(2017)]|nr:MAG: hypothetical protein CFE21_12465 [Bacteroidetes bacterium B1(2017)]